MSGHICETVTNLQREIGDLKGLIELKDRKIKQIEDKPDIQKKLEMSEKLRAQQEESIKTLKENNAKQRASEDQLRKDRNTAQVRATELQTNLDQMYEKIHAGDALGMIDIVEKARKKAGVERKIRAEAKKGKK